VLYFLQRFKLKFHSVKGEEMSEKLKKQDQIGIEPEIENLCQFDRLSEKHFILKRIC